MKEFFEQITKLSRSGGCPDILIMALVDCFDSGLTKEILISMGCEWELEDESTWQKWLAATCPKLLPEP